VNREQEVIDQVQIESVVNTEPLREAFSIKSYDEPLMRGTEIVFEIDTIGHQAQTTASGSLAAPVDEQESFDLFSKLQDEESMDALDPTKEPPADWEPGPEDEADIMVNAKWDDLHDGFGIVVADLESSLDDPVRMYLLRLAASLCFRPRKKYVWRNAWNAARPSFRRLLQIAVTSMTVMKHSAA